jgi:transcriptional regulator with PAS, ATPase and Fis domain
LLSNPALRSRRPFDGSIDAQIGRVLKQARGNKTEAARLLGISRRSLYRWMVRLNLTEARARASEDRLE